MKLFVISLLVLNAIYFFLPGGGMEATEDVSRGDRRVKLLVQLNEQPSEVSVFDTVSRDNEGVGVSQVVAVPSEIAKVENPKEELPSAQREAAALEKAGGVKEENAPVCFTVGPFHRESKAELLTSDLQRTGFKVDWRASKERRTRGYSVFLPSYPSYEAAESVVKKLSEHGVSDYYILTDSNRRNAISLGFFTLKSGSEKRVNRLKKMGYSPQVEVRFDEVPVFWLDYESSKKAESDAFWKQNSPADNLELLPRDCK